MNLIIINYSFVLFDAVKKKKKFRRKTITVGKVTAIIKKTFLNTKKKK